MILLFLTAPILLSVAVRIRIPEGHIPRRRCVIPAAAIHCAAAAAAAATAAGGLPAAVLGLVHPLGELLEDGVDVVARLGGGLEEVDAEAGGCFLALLGADGALLLEVDLVPHDGDHDAVVRDRLLDALDPSSNIYTK